MDKKKKPLSVFDLLKQGTTFKDKPRETTFNKRPHPDKPPQQKKAQKKVDPDKYNREDSESEIEEEGYFIPEALEEKRGDDDEIDSFHKLKNQRKDRINKLLKKHRIKIEGEDCPYPVSNFTKMKKRYDIPDTLLNNMLKSEFQKPTPVQMQSVPILLNDRNLISIAPTGSGKTLAYLLPIYCRLREH
jgi:ATP-dependent RNA helicase DDX52/ROK1